MKSFSIEPLLLIPFVENSFKHVSHYSNGKKNEIRIELLKQNGEIKFNVGNTTEGKNTREPDGQRSDSHVGIGLVNVKRRLELLYPHRHKLDISDSGGWFDVQLKIKTDQ